MSELISGRGLRSRVRKIEESIRAGIRKERTVTILAYVFFLVFEFKFSPGGLGSVLDHAAQNRKYDVPPAFSPEANIALLQLGIDPGRYARFKALVPTIAHDRTTEHVVAKWDKETDIEDNWSLDNLWFCVDFLIEVILKTQDRNLNPWRASLIHYRQVYTELIGPAGKQATFYDRRSYSPSVSDKAIARNAVLILRAGESLEGWVIEGWDRWAIKEKEEVCVFSHELTEKAGQAFAFVDIAEIRVVRQRRR